MYNRNENLSGAEARAFLRNWLRENGVASKVADSLTMAELNEAWTDQSNQALASLKDRKESAAVKPVASIPAAGNEAAASLMLQALSLVQT